MKTRFNLLAFAISFFLLSCGDNTNTDKVIAPSLETVPTGSSVTIPDDILDGSMPPYDLERNASVLDGALFAWREMIALSWQSTYSDATIERGQPDLSWTYAQGTPKNPLVWETYAHRIEYRPKGDSIKKDFNSKPSYPFVNESQIHWNGIDPSEQFIVLDEDNEIGSCYVFAKPNITKVTPDNKLVMYMAKVNEIEYNYRKKYFNSHSKLENAQNKISMTGEKGLDLLKEISTYKGSLTDPCGANYYGKQGLIVYPCSDESTKQRGVIEIKTAWRPLSGTDNQDEFLVRDAIVFDKSGDSTNAIYTANKVSYVLIGMHIIHKTNNFRNFFIATWEHNSVENYGYKFVIDNPPSPASEEDYKIISVERHDDADGAHSYISEAYNTISSAIQAKIKKANPDNPNFLANYRLTGFQSDLYPNDQLKDRKKLMPAYYLANLVIESDSTLADFSGSSADDPFNDGNNVVVDGKFITAGGCAGCHGAAQVKGRDFSFLNDNFEKPVPYPDVVSLNEDEIKAILPDSLR